MPDERRGIERQIPPERQAELDAAGLRLGSVRVWRDRKQVFAIGDVSHCPEEDILHNLSQLLARMDDNPKLRAIWKAYQAHVVEYTCPLSQITHAMFVRHGNPLWRITEDGREEIHCKHGKWAQLRQEFWECTECHERLSTGAWEIRYYDYAEAYEKRALGDQYMDYTLTRTIAGHDG
ncbi:MAG: hypothetical protein HN396_04515 [Gemmatimonadales bacterium]|nr:hypothetical protein [Gemmatimonadales bacterium]